MFSSPEQYDEKQERYSGHNWVLAGSIHSIGTKYWQWKLWLNGWPVLKKLSTFSPRSYRNSLKWGNRSISVLETSITNLIIVKVFYIIKFSKNVLMWVSSNSLNLKQTYLVQIQYYRKKYCALCFVYFLVKQKTGRQSTVKLVN